MRKHSYKVYLKFLKVFKCLASSSIHKVSKWLNLLFKHFHQERKRRKERILTRLPKHFQLWSFYPYYRHLVYEFLIKLCLHPWTSINLMCATLGPYISLVSNYIHPITPYWSKFINYLHQHVPYIIYHEISYINTLFVFMLSHLEAF